jgi:hypothetical protein
MVEGSADEAARRNDEHLNLKSWGSLTEELLLHECGHTMGKLLSSDIVTDPVQVTVQLHGV